MKKINAYMQLLLLSVVLLSIFVYGRFREHESQSERSDRRADGCPELQDRHEIPVAAGTRGSRAGAYVPVQRKPVGRSVRRLYRSDGRQLAHEVRDLQSFGRLAQMAVRQRDYRDLHAVARYRHRYGRRGGRRFRQTVARGDHAPRDRLLRAYSPIRTSKPTSRLR